MSSAKKDERNNNGTFKQGVSGNPKGRPKGAGSIPDLLRKITNEPVPKELQKRIKKVYPEIDLTDINLLEGILRTTIMYAIQGKPWAIDFVANRLEGKATEVIAQVGEKWEDVIHAIYSPTES